MSTAKLLLYLLCCAAAGAVAGVVYGDQAKILIINARHGCHPWSPRIVEFHQGMTLCPGQSTEVKVRVRP